MAKLYRDQLKDLVLVEFGSFWKVEQQGMASVVVRKTHGRDTVRSEALAQYLELVPLVIEEYERELARLRDRYYNSQIDEE